jgi:glycosyltransferase involved in cell wall biosynthesis
VKKEILFVYPEMLIGGSTTSLLSLLNTIDYSKYKVDLIMYRNRGEFLKDIPRQVNILPQACKYPAFTLTAKLKKLLLVLLSGYLLKAIFDELRYKKRIGVNGQSWAYAQAYISRKLEKKYDVAIGYLEFWSDAYALNNVKAKKKITWIHVDYENARLIPEIDIKQLSRSDNIVCVSEQCLQNFKKTFPSLANKAIFFDNILSTVYVKNKSKEDIEHFDNEYKGFRIITVCRLSLYHKGLDRIVWAMKKLCDEGYDLRWYIVGEGEDRGQIESMIDKCGLQGKIVLLGKKTNPYPYLKKCDIYVMPSRYEGKPMAVTEAQIIGLPVIVTRYASAYEQIIDNLDGIIVDNNDETIYYGIKKVLDQPELLERYKNNLLTRQLSNEHIIDRFYSLLE